MPESPLYELYRLHLIDAALEEMKKRAASLDGGRSILAEIQALKNEHREALNAPTALEQRIKDCEARVEDHRGKFKKLEKELYGGSVVSSKEATAYEKEIAAHKAAIADLEVEILEAMEALPAAQEGAKPIRVQIARLAKAFELKKQSDLEETASLKQLFSAKQAERAPQAALVNKPLLTQYDAIRSKHGGTGMGVVKDGNCGACGTLLPTKVREYLDSDRVITCENCRRILFKVVPGS